MQKPLFFVSLGIAALAVMSACTVKDIDQPALSGPSTLGTSITLSASSDTLIQDGASQASISIKAVDAQGNPKNIPLRAEIRVDNVVQDFGRLNTKQPIANGAPLIYTAPPASSLAGGQVAQTVQIVVTPMDGSDFANEIPRSVDIRLVPQGVILPTNPNLAAAFTVSPASPQVLQTATFDASTTTNNGAACNSSCAYSWDFGDGTTGNGISLTHTYRTVGSFSATLTVTDARGAMSTLTRTVTVAPGTPPTVNFTFSPSPAFVDATVFFNATESVAAPGRTIVRYDWDFGKGTTGSGVTVSKSYDLPGTYTVTLKVTDDAGAVASTSKSVVVTAPIVVPDFTFLPAAPVPGQPVSFNASSTTGPSPIVDYQWSFPGGTPATASGLTATTQWAAIGDKVVTLTVTDSAGRTATTNKVVPVK
jgi:PKD repeat protein